MTVEAIFEATIQVLLAEGGSRLTTTRVAERAGVSVGTMYQYFPHKQALLHALLQKHLDGIASAVEAVCVQLRGKSLTVISEGLATAYVAAKTARLDASRALYSAAIEIDASDVAADMTARIYAALRELLACCSDATFDELDTVAFVLQQALSGTVRAVIESDGGPNHSTVAVLYEQLPILCRAYLMEARLN